VASSVTHNTGVALAGAAAVAAAVSAGVSGATVAEATTLGIQAARLAAGRGHWVAGADVAARIEWATGLVTGRAQADWESGGEAEAAGLIYTLVGTSLAAQESVPAAFAVLAAMPADPWRACRMAASLGGDSDTIAAMTGAIDAQGLRLAALAGELLALRGGYASEAR
jgi:ADP-ribosylglycohydrolase